MQSLTGNRPKKKKKECLFLIGLVISLDNPLSFSAVRSSRATWWPSIFRLIRSSYSVLFIARIALILSFLLLFFFFFSGTSCRSRVLRTKKLCAYRYILIADVLYLLGLLSNTAEKRIGQRTQKHVV